MKPDAWDGNRAPHPKAGEIATAGETAAPLTEIPGTPSAGAAFTPQIQLPGYSIVREIGRGGQAIVVLANQLSTGRRVAVKLMRDGPFANERSRTRFKREVEALAALNHPGIVTIIDTGKSADGSQFIAMDYIAGCSLDEYMSRRQKASPDDPGKLLRIFLKVCAAMNVAHMRGIIHRDLKPSNIRIDERGEPHILDFGLARTAMDRFIRGDPQHQSITGEFLGSLPWCSPEQAQGDPDNIDTRTDVYSLGVILYQILTEGKFPYRVAGNIHDVLHDILTAEPIPPSKIIASARLPGPRGAPTAPESATLNQGIEKIVLKALAKKPEARYQTAGELGRDLFKYLSGQRTNPAPAAQATQTIQSVPVAGNRFAFRLAQACVLLVLIGGLTSGARYLLHRPGRRVSSTIESVASVRDLVQTEAPIAANGSPVQAQLIPALSPAIPTAAGNTVGVGVGPSRSDAAAPRLQKVLDQTVALRATDVGQEVRRQFDADLAAARASLGADDLDAAAGHIQRALALDPADPAAIALQQNINRKNIEEQAQLAAQKIFVDRDQAQAQKKGAKIDELLNTAKTNDNGDKGRIALAALDELLALDPSNDQAKNLRNKISRYYLPGAATDAWANSIGMRFVYIQAGEFAMGSPLNEPGRSPDEPQHHVTITKPFLMDTTLVTVAQFRIFAQDTKYQTDAQKAGGGIVRGPQQWTYTAGASWMAPSFAQQDDHPVVEISWNDAMAFCQWLGSKEARIYRLPTEAEWEYCCRAGTQTAYPWGDNKEEGRGWANCADATLLANATGSDLAVFAWSDGYVFTSPVAKFKPNAWGLYDMIGNAWEWCGDWYGDYRGIAVDPQGPSTGKSKVLRGGSWESGPRQSRCAYRSKSMPDERSNICGFRIVRQPPPL